MTDTATAPEVPAVPVPIPERVTALAVIPELAKFKEDMAALAQSSALMKFDYRSKEGDKAARSHVHQLRRFKASIDDKRKEIVDDALKLQRSVNGVAKDMIALMDDIISVHADRIALVEKESEEREAREKEVVDQFVQARSKFNAAMPSAELRAEFERLEAIDLATAGESQERAKGEKLISLRMLESAHNVAKSRELEAAELAALRKEKADREKREKEEADAKKEQERLAQVERDRLAKVEADRIATAAREEQIKKETAERVAKEIADKAAAEQAKKDKSAADAAAAALKKQQDEHAAELKRQKDKADAEAEALRLKNEAAAKKQKEEADRLAKELQEKKDKEAREQAAADNAKRRKVVHDRIAADFNKATGGDFGKCGSALVDAILAGSIRHLSITYTDMP